MFPSFCEVSNGITQINTLFRRIENEFESDNSNTKPARYTKAMTSHSVKCGGTNTMNNISGLKTEWMELRSGWQISKNNTKGAYIKREFQNDHPCALALAGWERVENGGKCPNINCIPEINKIAFNHFINQLFGAVTSLPNKIAEMLGCILLLWHFDVKLAYPTHPIVQRIDSLETHPIVQRIEIFLRGTDALKTCLS
jgi:hypothetical protein